MFDWLKSLFGGTSGADRSKEADPVRLDSFCLPLWEDPKQLAEALDISVKKLWYFGSHHKSDGTSPYTVFAVPKRSGGSRTILAPRTHLKLIQRKIQRQLVDELPVSEWAHGFRKGRSIATNASPHLGADVVIRLDLDSFFRSVTFPRIQGLLMHFGYGYRVSTILAVLMTGTEKQAGGLGDRYAVQGAPTSPGICNAVANRLDERLAGLADSFGYSYTRYADDMTFSGPENGHVGGILKMTDKIIRDEGFALNSDKTRVMRDGSRKEVTGVVVNETLGLSRKKRRRIRAQIHQMKIARREGRLEPEEVEQLEGKLACLEMINADQAAKLRAQWEDTASSEAS